jgi:hypothetical protein
MLKRLFLGLFLGALTLCGGAEEWETTVQAPGYQIRLATTKGINYSKINNIAEKYTKKYNFSGYNRKSVYREKNFSFQFGNWESPEEAEKHLEEVQQEWPDAEIVPDVIEKKVFFDPDKTPHRIFKDFAFYRLGRASHHFYSFYPPANESVRNDPRSPEELLALIKREPQPIFHFQERRILIFRGKEVLPLLLEEWNRERYNAESLSYQSALVDILARIDAPERDQAFLFWLKSRAGARNGAERFAPQMLEALLRTQREKALEIIDEPDECNSYDKKRRVILNAAGMPPAPASAENLRLEWEEPQAADVPLDIATARAIVVSLAEQEAIATNKPVVANKIEPNAMDGWTISGIWPEYTYEPIHAEEGETKLASWRLEIGAPQEGRVPVHYTYHCGPRCAAGYAGVMEQRDGRWLLIYWQMLWIS